MCRLAEADATHVKIAQVPVLSTTLEAAANDLALVLWCTTCTKND